LVIGPLAFTSNWLSTIVIPHPLHECIQLQPQQAAFSMDDRPLQRWSRSDWIIFFGNQGPTIREIIECLGLSHTTDRGAPKFTEPESRNLSKEIQKLSQTLPANLDALLESASDSSALNEKLDGLLRSHGPAIWGESADRGRLLKAAGTSNTNYPKDLLFDVPMDREM
jgi:hypothetical protein